MKIFAFGEILWDVYPDKKYIGGAPLNFASHCAKQGANAFLVSAVGNDSLGEEAILSARSFGIKTDYISVLNNKETGKCVVSLDENKIPSYNLMQDVAYDYIDDPKDEEYDLLYFGTLAARQEYNKNTLQRIVDKKLYKKIFSDVNVRKPFCTKDSILFVVKNSNYIKISDEEMNYVSEVVFGRSYDDAFEFAKKLGDSFSNLELIILTFGEKGSGVYDCREDKKYMCSAKKTEVISSVGAGDSFGASFIVAMWQGKDIQVCLEIASKVSGFVVANKDAVPDYDISDFI